MSSFSSPPQALGLDLYESSTTQAHRIGERAETSDGRVFRYARVGASTLVAGNVVQSPAQVTTHKAMTPAAAALGATSVTATLGATNAVTENQYADGYLIVAITPGNGYAYRISSHPAAAASAACVFTLSEPINVALTTSSRVSLQANPCKGVIQAPTTLTGTPAGVAVFPALANEYCWIQTRGLAPVLTAGTPAVGAAVGVPGSAAGAVVIDGAATSGLYPVGTMAETGVDGSNCAVLLHLE